MKKLIDSRLVIIDSDANVIEYPKFGMMHQDCLDDFVEEKNKSRNANNDNNDKLKSSDRDYLVSKGNIIFYHSIEGMFGIFLPEKLTAEQLYQLDYIENWLDGVIYLHAIKGLGEKREEFLFDIDNGDNIKERFSNEVIQSYYQKSKKR